MKITDYINSSNKEKLLELVGEKRYNHSIGVMDTAAELADVHGVDIDKAKIAGLYHDIGKYADKTTAKNTLKDHGINMEDLDMPSFHLVHGLVGKYMAMNTI